MDGDGWDGTARPALSLVVSTVGRPEALERLLRSLALEADNGADFELVVVDQDPEQRSLDVLHALEPPFPWQHLTSGRGVSVGRNTGLQAARGEVIGFPDDNCWFTGATLRALDRLFAARPELDIVCGRQLTEDGRPSMLRWARTARPVTKANHHRTSIASTIFMRRRALRGIPWFDEDLGVGTSTWFGACEESDLLLRAVANGAPAWYDPAVVVLQDDPRDAISPEYRTKMLRYGCGQGRLWRLHRLPPTHVASLLGRKLAKVGLLVLRRRFEGAWAEVAWVHGALCGLAGRPPRQFASMPSSTRS